MKFINVGFGNMIAADRVVALVSPDSAPVKRLIGEAREAGRIIDVTCGRRTRAVIVTDSDHVILSATQPGNHLQPSGRRRRDAGRRGRGGCGAMNGTLVFIISGPAGSGKGSVVNEVLRRDDGFSAR